MKKLLCLVLGCVLLCASFGALAEASPTPTEAPTVVRGVKWGMTAEEIIALEGREPDQRESEWIVFENVTAGGWPASVGYEFNEAGTCCTISYTFDDVDTKDYNVYIEDYSSLKKALITKYGEPVLDEEIWDESTYNENPAQYGIAVASGELTCQTEFETENTHITLLLWGYAAGEDSHYLYILLEYGETTPSELTMLPESAPTARVVVLDSTL
jgi:hypothetical protein